MTLPLLDIRPEVAEALHQGQAIVALESTLIAHGLPWPLNVETALAAEAAVRSEGAIPATIAVWRGRPTVGLNQSEIRELGQAEHVVKASARDLAAAVSLKRTAATTVAATLRLAHLAGIRVFATGGLGGVHRGAQETGDVSADLPELARTPVAVVCAGAKSLLDLPRTLEFLETEGIPVVGYKTDTFPAFYVATSDLSLSTRVEDVHQTAELLQAHWTLGGHGVVIAQPLAAEAAITPEVFENALAEAELLAGERRVRGPEVTPFLLARLAEITQGATLRANHHLILANAHLAAQIARALLTGSNP